MIKIVIIYEVRFSIKILTRDFRRLIGNNFFLSIFVFQMLLNSPRYIEKSTEYRFIKPWLNEGLLLSKGKQIKKDKILSKSI